MKKDTAKVTPAKIHKRGVWYDALRCPELYDAAVASLKTNDLIEFEVMDRSGARLGNCISEVVGQRMSGDKGLPLVLISPPVAEEETVRSWMNPSLAAPNALHLCKAAARLVDVGSESYYIHKVERFRVHSPSSVGEDWALAVHERQPDPVPLQGYRPPAGPAAVEPELPPPLQARPGVTRPWPPWTTCDASSRTGLQLLWTEGGGARLLACCRRGSPGSVFLVTKVS